jgi:hypothetical protein
VTIFHRAATPPLLLLLGGCYTYVPVETAIVPEGEQVRVHLTREGVLALPELDGREGPILTGAVASRSADRISIRVPVVIRREGFLQNTLGQNVAVPLAQIERMETRKLSRSRTGLVVVGTAGVAALVVFKIVDGAWFHEPPGPAGGSDLRAPPF